MWKNDPLCYSINHTDVSVMVRFPDTAYINFGETVIEVALPSTTKAEFKFSRLGDSIPCVEDSQAVRVYFIVKKEPLVREEGNNPFKRSRAVKEGTFSRNGDTITHTFRHQAFDFVARMEQGDGECTMNFSFTSLVV